MLLIEAFAIQLILFLVFSAFFYIKYLIFGKNPIVFYHKYDPIMWGFLWFVFGTIGRWYLGVGLLGVYGKFL